ncbi:unnamed protein product, partial [Tuber aestivum]
TIQHFTTSWREMGNLCSGGESIRKMETEIGELRNDIARLAKDIEASDGNAGRGTAAGDGSGSSHQVSGKTAAATKRRSTVGQQGGPRGSKNYKLFEEQEGRRRRAISERRDRS